MANPEQDIKLELSFEEVNLILKGLGYLPFKDVFELVGKIHDQANEQFRHNQAKGNFLNNNNQQQDKA